MHIKAALALLLLFSMYGTAFSADGWYNPSWQYRRAITLGETRNITRINEPVYVTISGTDGRIGNCTKELRITDANGTEVPSQVDSDSVAGGTYSCTAVFIANSSALGSSTYYTYYGNPSAAAPNYPSQDASFSVTASLLKNSYYNLPIDSYGFIYPSFSSAGSGSYDITMATGRPYCDNQRWMFSLIQNGTGYSIGSGGGCTNPATSWSVGKSGSVFKEVQANFATNPSATYYWRTRLFPKSRYIEVSLDARLSAAVNLTDASMSMVPGSHSTAWDQSSSASSSTLYMNMNSSWGTYGSGSVIFGNVRNVTLSKSVAGWEGGVGLHDTAYLLGMPSNVLTCASYPCTYTYSFRLAWTTDYTVAANRITGSMLDSPLSVSVGAPQSFFISAGISPAGKTTYPNTNETFSLWLNNNQSIADNFTLSCPGTCYYSENPMVTTAGQNKSVTVTITSAGVSGTTAYTITATSSANASNFAGASVSLTVDAATWRSQWVDAYNNPFAYRTPITVTNNGSALTDYQVPINITNLVYNNTGLAGSWHFSEGAGTRFADSSGNGNDGTYAGEALNNGTLTNFNFNANSGWADGKYGKALRFDGANDYIQIPSPSGLSTGAAPRTMSAWIKLNFINASDLSYANDIVGYGSLGAGQMSKIIAYRGKLYFHGSSADLSGNVPLSIGNWYHVAATYDGTNVTLYVNGVRDTSAAIALNTVISGEGIIIGKYVGASSEYFNGTIDDVRVYNRALSPSEIAQLYQNSTFIRSGLAGYWRLDENAGAVAQDTHHIATEQNKNSTRFGNALTFDGINDYANAGHGTPLNDLPAFTYEAWVNYKSFTTGPRILDKTNKIFYITSGDYLEGSIVTSATWGVSTANTAVPKDAWTHVAMTFDNAGDKKIRLYINGVEAAYTAQTAASGALTSEAANDLVIGNRPAGDRPFNGTIDEVRIYNRALSAQEISARYSAGKLRLDYADLRFANSSTSQLPYWIENDNRAWVRVPYVPNGASTVYAYYGNPAVASASSGTATFEFFDDFDSASLDGGKWTQYTPIDAPASAVVTGGSYTMTTSSAMSSGSGLNTLGKYVTGPGHALLARYTMGTETNWVGSMSLTDGGSNYLAINGYPVSNGGATNVRLTNSVTAGATTGGWVFDPLAMTFYKYELKWNSSNIKLFIDDIEKDSSVTNIYAGNNAYINYETRRGYSGSAGAVSKLDLVLVRKYASPEPALSLQQEELQSPALFVGISPPSKTTYPGYNETFSLWVYNNQTLSDTFTLSCAGACSVSPPSLTLAPYQNGSATVTITSANVSGTTNYVTTATSQSNASNFAAISASLTVDTTRWRDQWTDAYGNGFRYRVPITINNTGSALTDYQVGFTVDTATPIGLTRMRSDCGDLRLTNGTNEMPYWVESGCNTTFTKIWARAPYVPAGNSTVYAYYGNNAAAGDSNGDATFEFFDGFPGTSLNTSKWTELDDAGALTPSVSGNVLTLSYNGNDRGYVYRNIAQGNSNIAVEMEAYDDYVSGSNVNWGKIIVAPAHGNDLHTGAAIVFEALQMDGTHKLFVKDVNYNYNAAVEWPEATFKRIKFTRFNGAVKAYVEDVEKASAIGESDAGDYISLGGQIVDHTTYNYNRITKYKNVRVRKYAAAEPSALSGAEQSKGYRTLVRRCGLKQANATVTAYQAGNSTGSCLSDANGICTLEISAGIYDLQLTFADNSTAWKNGTVFS